MRPVSTQAPAQRWYLSAVTVFQNEAPYLDEWLAFCLLEGVDQLGFLLKQSPAISQFEQQRQTQEFRHAS